MKHLNRFNESIDNLSFTLEEFADVMQLEWENYKGLEKLQEQAYFYDGHGEPDFGGETKYVTSDPRFHKLDPSKTYNDDLEEVDDEENEDLYAEDGYNCERSELNFREITEEQAKVYEKIIADYNALTADLSEHRDEQLNKTIN